MAKKRGGRAARFATLRSFFNSSLAGLMTQEAVKANVESTGFVVYDSELLKFTEEYPDVDMEKFLEWLKANGGHKVAGKKITGTPRQYRLNTKEKALEVGVREEDVEEYIKLVNLGYQLKDKLQKLMSKGTVTLTIPIRQPKEAEVTP